MNRRKAFLQEVTNQIKSSEAKEYVTNELNYHLTEAKKIWQEKGLPETVAEEKAVEQMGSPVNLGIQMDKLHRPKVDWWMVILLILILGLGFLPMISLGYMDDVAYFSINKVIIFLLGGLTALGMMLFDYRKLKNHGMLFYLIGVIMLLLIRFLPNMMINGIPLIRIGPIRVESLMAIPFLFLAWASFFHNVRLKVWQFVLLFLFPFLLFLAMPSISTSYIYSVMVFVMLWWSKFSRRTIMTTTGVFLISQLIVGFGAFQILKEYQLVRFLAYLNPEKYSDGAGYQILRVKELMSNAGWFGNTLKKEFISEAHTNLVFVTLTYHYGWLLAIALVVILSLIAVRMISIACRINDSYGRVLLIGAVALYMVQFVSNIGMSLGFFPLTVMSLPFISYGLMPTLLNAGLIGVVLSVYRRKDLIPKF
ncbi:MAG: cell division protein FtsW [Neobacillus sp.]|jgi:cell division protein FtsW (lipid II flippase)|nr:cell division protein FtsW [Neobacillus sp.]